MDMRTLAGTLAYSSVCYLMANYINQEMFEIGMMSLNTVY